MEVERERRPLRRLGDEASDMLMGSELVAREGEGKERDILGLRGMGYRGLVILNNMLL